MITHLHNATILVSDQDAALDFYVNVLGFKVGMDMPMGLSMRWLTVIPPDGVTEIALSVASWYEASEMGPAKTPPSKHTQMSFAATDIEATYATLVERGVKFKGPLMDMPWGDKATWFYDPDGNEFFLDGR